MDDADGVGNSAARHIYTHLGYCLTLKAYSVIYPMRKIDIPGIEQCQLS